MKQGRKPTPRVTFYMRSCEYGDIKIMFCYNGYRWSGGSTYLSIGVDEFEMLSSDGTPRVAEDVRNPKMANGIPISDLLTYLRLYIVGKVEERLRDGMDVDEVYVKELCGRATKAMYEQLRLWSSNLDWNRNVNRAIEEGGDALSRFIGRSLNTMFTAIEVEGDGTER